MANLLLSLWKNLLNFSMGWKLLTLVYVFYESFQTESDEKKCYKALKIKTINGANYHIFLTCNSLLTQTNSKYNFC